MYTYLLQGLQVAIPWTPRDRLPSCPVYLFASLSTSSSVVLTRPTLIVEESLHPMSPETSAGRRDRTHDLRVDRILDRRVATTISFHIILDTCVPILPYFVFVSTYLGG
uniref:Uncharacterized protein n=1 Tax=Cacopsylla melanoneura TaxID=428564 RepID=A0A8D8QV82_9HEMI